MQPYNIRMSDKLHNRYLPLNLVDHLVFDDGAAIEHFHGYALAGLRVLRELYFCECSFADCPPNLVFPHFPHHHLSLSLSKSRAPAPLIFL
uniref:Uncharacterized protein MANES_18G055300 n=1 Tax=Rhizophora mucronata TaxID=61149 RepID=A0A2P2JFX7_RHIMU